MAGLRNLSIDGTSLLSNFGVWINGDDVFSGAEADIETVKIPGRNGDLVYSNKRYNNFILNYKCMIPANMTANLPALRAFLYQTPAYRKIKDSYFPSMYRLGRITGNMNPSSIAWAQNGGIFSISFDCKPQHYYDSGDFELSYTSSGSVRNDTLYDALPILRVYGTGNVTLNGVTITIASHSSPYTELDCELQDAYYNTVNLNNKITLSGDAFPKLSPGNNALTLGGSITRVVVIPRWWSL